MTHQDLKEAAEKATPIPNAQGYRISDDGTIYSVSSNWRGYGPRTITPILNASGYPSVRLSIDGKRRHLAVHRLVAAAFLPRCPSSNHEIRHLDGDRMNPNRSNLTWGTREENAADRKSHGTERAAENGRNSAYKLRGIRSEFCIRGHHKEGRKGCEQCRREKRARAALKEKQP